MARGNGGNIESKTLLTINKTQDEERGKGVHLRVVDWISGDKHYPQLEKREFFKDEESGQWKTGKAKGLNSGDFLAVMKVWPKVVAYLGGDLKAISAAIGSASIDTTAAEPARSAVGPASAEGHERDKDQQEDF